MNEPKRHHWWPQLQSRHWTGKDGTVFAIKADGTYFPATPLNVSVETELYTRVAPTGEKDRDIEKWFSQKIETPFGPVLDKLLKFNKIERRRVAPNSEKARCGEVRICGLTLS